MQHDRHQQRGAAQDQPVNALHMGPGAVAAGVSAQKGRDHDAGNTVRAIEYFHVLLHEKQRGHADGQREHQQINLVRALRNPANQGGHKHRCGQRQGRRQLPGQGHAHAGGIGTEQGDAVTGDAGNRHLAQRHHAAKARQKGQTQRHDAQGKCARQDVQGPEFGQVQRRAKQQQRRQRHGRKFQRLHQALPYKPLGRKASTAIIKPKVIVIA